MATKTRRERATGVFLRVRVSVACALALVFVAVGGEGGVTGVTGVVAQGEPQPIFSMVSVSSSRVAPGGSVIITARIVDVVSDVENPPSIGYLLPDGNDGPFAFFTRVSGTPRDGTYRAIVTVSRFYPPGQYVVKELRAFDREGNVTVLTPPQAIPASLALTVTTPTGEPAPAPTATSPGVPPPANTPAPTPRPPVAPAPPAPPPATPLATVTVRNPDNVQPALISLEISDVVAVPGATLVVTARITDSVADVADFPSIRYRLPDGSDGPFAYLRRVAGDARNGVYEATIGLSPFYPAGVYTIKELRVADTARNSVVYAAPAPMQPDAPFVVRPFVPPVG